jgi:non-ribosomal peptide synthetase component F
MLPKLVEALDCLSLAVQHIPDAAMQKFLHQSHFQCFSISLIFHWSAANMPEAVLLCCGHCTLDQVHVVIT